MRNCLTPSLIALGLILGVIRPPARAVQYLFTELGTLGGTHSSASSINNSGQVVGFASITGNAAAHPALWNGSVAADLGTLGGAAGFATGINDSGQISGYTQNFANNLHATGWYGAGLVDLGMVDNPSGTGARSYANGIDNAGRIVGSGQTADYYRHATLWKAPNEMKHLGGGDVLLWSEATAISNTGTIVGWWNTTLNQSPRRAVKWTGTLHTPTFLNSLGGPSSSATAVNDAGVIVGQSQINGTTYHAVRWDGATPQDLGTLGGSNSYATSVNAGGLIVGHSQLAGNAASHAVVWNDGAITDLNSLLDPAAVATGWILDYAYDVNDSGWIVGQGHNTILGLTRGYRLEPVANPPNLADFDGDGFVDGADFAIWAANFGRLDAIRTDGDANDDGTVDGSDFLTWQRNLQPAVGTALNVPEPGAFPLCLLAIALVIRVR